MQLTKRDCEIVRHVFHHRFLRSSQVAALVGGSKQAVLRRLQLLYHHGYLERPRAQIEYYHQGGSRLLVYGLANRGAQLLRDTQGQTSPTPDWSSKNRLAKRLFLEHALLISDVMVALEVACRRNRRVRLLNIDELGLPANTHTRPNPVGWNVTVNGSTKLGVIPDRVFALEFPDQPTGRNRAYYFLEADRATMPVTRNNLRQTSFHRKLLAYEATWVQELHRKHFGFHRFRVLTVTTSADRMIHLVETCALLRRGQGLFLFTDSNSLAVQPDLLSLSWQSAHKGQVACLLDG